MQAVSIEKITKDNWKKACMIDIKPEQKHFLGSVVYCLARAYINPYSNPIESFVIYRDYEIVGFFWFTMEGNYSNCILCGFRIDKNFQGLGISKPALKSLIELLTDRYPDCTSIQLFVENNNIIAKNLYKSFGFETKKKIDPDLDLMVYRLRDTVEIKLVSEDYLDDG